MRLYILFLLCITSISLSAQIDNIIDENDPYSLFGPGDLRETLPAKSRAMGGVGIASNNRNRLNLSNPASLAWLRLTTLQSGFLVKNNWLTDETAVTSDLGSTQSGNLSMAYVSLGFPIWKDYIGTAISLQPYSRVSYDIYDEFLNTGSIDSTEYSYKGIGDIQTFSWSNGFKYKSVAAGFGADYYFGNVTRSTNAFTNETNFFGIRRSDYIGMTGLSFNAGLLVSHKFDSKDLDEEGVPKPEKAVRVNLGARYKTGASLNTDLERYWERIQRGSSGVVFPFDTVQAILTDTGKITLPSEMGIGIMIMRGNSLEIGLDYALYNGSEYRYLGAKDSLQNASKISLGMAITPNRRSKKYFSRTNYRFGGYYYTNHLRLFGEDIPEYGISFGLGLPIRPVGVNLLNQELSEVDIALVFGQRGQATNPLIKENFFKVTAGINLNAKWFNKRLID